MVVAAAAAVIIVEANHTGEIGEVKVRQVEVARVGLDGEVFVEFVLFPDRFG